MSTPSFRRRVETAAGPLVVVLARLPRIVPFLVVMALLLAGLFLQGVVGALLLLALTAGLAVLLALAWPALEPGARLLRLAVVALIGVRALSFLI